MDPQMTQVQQTEMLKLVTQSFCRELVNFGVPRTSLPTIASEVLDYVMNGRERPSLTSEHGPSPLELSEIVEDGIFKDQLQYGDVSIRPLTIDLLPTISEWLETTDVQRHFAVPFPTSVEDLVEYFFNTEHNVYFSIFYKDAFVGVIGGEQIDQRIRRVEMKKFIGDQEFRGHGIGKTATFLWLHHVFDQKNYNKVFIYSLDTNLRNINLNNQLGFELEGILFEDAMMDGKYCDVARMGLLKSKWDSLFRD